MFLQINWMLNNSSLFPYMIVVLPPTNDRDSYLCQHDSSCLLVSWYEESRVVTWILQFQSDRTLASSPSGSVSAVVARISKSAGLRVARTETNSPKQVACCDGKQNHSCFCNLISVFYLLGIQHYTTFFKVYTSVSQRMSLLFIDSFQ